MRKCNDMLGSKDKKLGAGEKTIGLWIGYAGFTFVLVSERLVFDVLLHSLGCFLLLLSLVFCFSFIKPSSI